MSVLRLKIAGMDCGSCALTIESAVRRLPGVDRVAVDFATESMQVEGSVDRARLERCLADLGYRLGDERANVRDTAGERLVESGLVGFLRYVWVSRRLRIAALAAIPATLAWPLDQPWLAGGVALAVGAPIFLKGVRALVIGHRATIELLMTLAAFGALLIDAAGEAATVVLLFTLGEALEAYSAERARASLRSLLALQPQTALRLWPATVTHGHVEGRPQVAHDHDHDHDQGHDHGHAHDHDHDHGHDHGHAQCGTGTPQSIPVSEVGIGDRLLIRPGARVPVDGRILVGESALDESAVTGESVPVRRKRGDPVLAGTVNGDGVLEIEATRVAADSTVARIARLVEEARARRSPAERWVDRFARVYTPLVVLLAGLVVAVPVIGFGEPLLEPGNGQHGWLYRGLALLIVACPCALVISIPVAVVSALTRLAHLGVLVRGGAQLDTLARLRAIAFDKTGTLTQGRPAVTALNAADCTHPAEDARDCDDCAEVLALAHSVESRSEHPISGAIVTAARTRGVASRYAEAHAVRAVPGRGIVGEVGGRRIAVGSEALFTDGEHRLDVPAEFAAPLRASERTVMLVARDGQLLGAIGVEDQLRDGSVEALDALTSQSPPVHTVMLTGDRATAAARVAAQLPALAEVRAGLVPEQKLAAIEELQRRFGAVGMVGDGINDTPALARADIGIAMGGSGTAQAMETADVVLMREDLRLLPRAIAIARRTQRIVRQNVALSLALKLGFVALAIPGLTTLWLAVVADVGATLLVTFNAMRLLRS